MQSFQEESDIPSLGGDLRPLLELNLVRQDALRGELLDLIAPVLVPILNVRVPAHTEGPAGVDESGDSVLKAGAHDELLVLLGSTSLDGGDKTGSNP